MDSHDAQMPASGHQVRKPTEYLTQARIDELSQFSIFLLAKEGFTLQDVRAMVSTSKLYASSKVIERIVGKPRPKKIGKNDDGAFRLNAFQSAVAFQFARVLEHATTVFGSLQLAEEWLQKPCRHLADLIPLTLVDNPVGFRVIEDYLGRVEFGIYQ